MNINDGHRLVERILLRYLESEGFEEVEELVYVSRTSDCLKIVSSRGGRIDKQGRFWFNIGIGVRFEMVERVLANKTEDQRFVPTWGCGIHILRPRREFAEWCVTEQTRFVPIETSVVLDIKTFGLPFLNRFCVLDQVRIGLESDNPRQWLVLSPEQRLETLAAIEYVQGRKARALEIIDDEIRKRSDAMPKYRSRFLRLKERILAL